MKRELRREARIRGSGKRLVKADDFSIDTTEDTQIGETSRRSVRSTEFAVKDSVGSVPAKRRVTPKPERYESSSPVSQSFFKSRSRNRSTFVIRAYEDDIDKRESSLPVSSRDKPYKEEGIGLKISDSKENIGLKITDNRPYGGFITDNQESIIKDQPYEEKLKDQPYEEKLKDQPYEEKDQLYEEKLKDQPYEEKLKEPYKEKNKLIIDNQEIDTDLQIADNQPYEIDKQTENEPYEIDKQTDNQPPKDIPSRRLFPRSSRPKRIKEIPSDDDLEESIEMDSIEYTKAFLKRKASVGSVQFEVDNMDDGMDFNMDFQVSDPANSDHDSDASVREKQRERRKSGREKQREHGKSGREKQRAKRGKSGVKSVGESGTGRKSARGLSEGLQSRRLPTPEKSPIPLSKKRPNEAQKPLFVDVERFATDKDRDKRTKIHTLDVCKQLVKDFEVDTDDIHETRLHEEFKLYLQHYMKSLADIHASMNDISQKIAKVQRQKNEVRSEIFHIKGEHENVGNALNELRKSYANERDSFNRINTAHAELEKLSSQPSTNKAARVEAELASLGKLVNPRSGLYSKFKAVNDKLVKINETLEKR